MLPLREKSTAALFPCENYYYYFFKADMCPQGGSGKRSILPNHATVGVPLCDLSRKNRTDRGLFFEVCGNQDQYYNPKKAIFTYQSLKIYKNLVHVLKFVTLENL